MSETWLNSFLSFVTLSASCGGAHHRQRVGRLVEEHLNVEHPRELRGRDGRSRHAHKRKGRAVHAHECGQGACRPCRDGSGQFYHYDALRPEETEDMVGEADCHARAPDSCGG